MTREQREYRILKSKGIEYFAKETMINLDSRMLLQLGQILLRSWRINNKKMPQILLVYFQEAEGREQRVKQWIQSRKFTIVFFGHHCTIYNMMLLLLQIVWYSIEGPYVIMILCISGAWHIVSTYGMTPKIDTVWKEKNERVIGGNIKGKQRI